MSSTHSRRGERLYHYYASRQETREERASAAWRVPAADLEEVVVGTLVYRLQDREALRHAAQHHDDVAMIHSKFERAAMVADEIMASALEKRELVANLVRRVTAHIDRVEILVCLDSLWLDETGAMDERRKECQLTVAARITRDGKRSVLAIAPAQIVATKQQDMPLIKLIIKAYAARMMVEAEPIDPKELAEKTCQDEDYFVRLIRLGYLAPDIISAILDGRQPATLTRQHLARVSKLPLDWTEQRQLLEFAPT